MNKSPYSVSRHADGWYLIKWIEYASDYYSVAGPFNTKREAELSRFEYESMIEAI